MITHGAALLGPQGHDHPLGCRYLHLLGDAPQRHRGPPLGGSSSVWRSSRRGLACSSASSSSDESFCTCLEHARNVMNLCSSMRMAELLAQQPLLSGAVVFGACVCGRVTTRLVQTCAVTLREHVGSSRRPWSGNKKISADGHVHTKQGHLWPRQPVPTLSGQNPRRRSRIFVKRLGRRGTMGQTQSGPQSDQQYNPTAAGTPVNRARPM